MKLLIVINDSELCRMHYEWSGGIKAINRRGVTITLTEDQVKQIGIKRLGVDCGRDVNETIESVSLQEPTDED